MPNIFISYRRSDSLPECKEIYTMLCKAFGEDNIFIDKEKMPIGEYFPAYLEKMLLWAEVILVVIGPDWHGGKDENGKYRIEDRFDYVRREVEWALFRKSKEGLVVVPLMIKGVSFSSIALPQAIDDLRLLNGYYLDKYLFNSCLKELIQKLATVAARNEQKPDIPQLIDQGINPIQSIDVYGGEYEQLPADATLFLWPKADGFLLTISCPSRPSIELYRDERYEFEMKGMRIREAVGLLMERYGVSKKQCMEWASWSAPKKDFLSVFLGRSKEKGDWYPTTNEVTYSNLHTLLREFDEYVFNANSYVGKIDFSIGYSIPDWVRIKGVLENEQDRIFGEYICSLTIDLGAEEVNSGRLFYFPTVKDTRLQYYNSHFVFGLNFRCCGHVGKDKKGYHIVYKR